MDRILRNSGATLQLNLYNADGNLENPAAGAITADVVDSGGTAIAGSPFAITNPPASTGVLVLSPGNIDALDTYSVTWNLPGGAKRYSHFEVVGAFLFSIADLRAFDKDMEDTAKYPAWKVVVAREAAEERLEGAMNLALRPRGQRVTLDGTGLKKIWLPDVEIRRVVSVKVGGVAYVSADLTDLKVFPHGLVLRDTRGVFDYGSRNVEILYEHGLTEAPEPVRRAALALAKNYIVKSPLGESERATFLATDMGMFRISQAGRDGPTGLPEVDAVIEQFGRRELGFA